MSISLERISQIPLFATLAEEDIKRVAAITRERRYERDDLILLEGEPGGGLHYLDSGLVKVFKTSLKGKEQVLRLITPGHTFNDVPAIDGGPNPASAAAVELSTIYIIKHGDLRELLRTRPQVAEAVMDTMASALRHLVALVEDLSLRHVTARVAKLLLEQPLDSPRRFTQQEMAALVGTAREVVGRALKDLEAAGAIEIHRGIPVVTDQQRLTLLAQG